MSLEAGLPWSYQDLKFHGLSLSGIRTCVTMPDLSLCFDVAQGLPYALHMRKYFITHGHLDHAAGIPYLISQKAMNSAPTPIFYMPPSLIEPMTEIMNLWEKIEKHEYRYEFHPATVDLKVDISQHHFVRPFPTIHRIESFGYTLFQRLKKLKAPYQGLSQDEIKKLKIQKVEVDEILEKPLVSFTGDTEIEFLDKTPWLKDSKILIVECTYLDDKKSVEHAKKWGHTHIDELLPRLSSLNCEKIVLIHASSRYSTPEAERLIRSRLPASELERVVLYPGR